MSAKRILENTILILLSFSALHANEPTRLKNVWEIGFTFGEIPFLAGSFKPGVSIGYHVNEYVSFTSTFQLTDKISRNASSFNARNIGLDGLTSSKETTGERILLAVQLRPVEWSPYLVAGFVFNAEDIETMHFDQRVRQIGSNTYDSQVTIVQSRKNGFVPAFGFGYRYDFDNGVSLNTNIAAGVFTGIPRPEAKITSTVPISEGDESQLQQTIQSVYKDNFHNHYHIFNLGVSYRLQ